MDINLIWNSIIVFIVTITKKNYFIIDHWIKQKVQDNFESNENWKPRSDYFNEFCREKQQYLHEYTVQEVTVW